ncbi:MAG TPA: hypothetical protein VM432_07140, partial [Bdellovibrionales bacterium]|nr:hypothetical protein [Bdellovibrionales bacterium]
MNAPSARFIQIDESGYFKMEELRVADAETGRAWLASMRVDGMKAFVTIEDRDVIVEAFDEPYVAVNVSREGSDWVLNLPYGYSEKFDIATLTIDEWDRFHGHTARGIPFVFSRAAQSTFFNLVDDYDDDSITVSGKQLILNAWLQANTDAEKPAWWSEFYKTNEPRWDLGDAHPALAQYVPGLKLQRSRILVLGAGRGH